MKGDYRETVRTAIAQFIDELLPKSHPTLEIDLLYQMMRDYPQREGKLIRGSLLMLCAQAYGASQADALPLAAALELFQNWVLIHDDIEDDSEARRGTPALHRLHGMPLALNAGDALHIYMWQAVFAGPPAARLEFLQMIHRTAEGQHMDLAWVQHQRWNLSSLDYLQMVQLKTAHYTVVSPLRLGMVAAHLEPNPQFLEAGLALGAAFQIRDDVLNLIGDVEKYGKEIGGDLLEGKRTLITCHYLEQAPHAQQTRFLEVMNQPRANKLESDIAELLADIRSSGAIEAAMEVATQQTKIGLDSLEQALKNAPERGTVHKILELMNSLATRVA